LNSLPSAREKSVADDAAVATGAARIKQVVDGRDPLARRTDGNKHQ